MAFFQIKNIKIAAIAAAIPEKEYKIDSFEGQFGKEYVEKFQENTGIRSIRKTVEHQTASDLAYAAAENLLAKHPINRDNIGALIFGTLSPDYRRPTTACVLHKRLGLSKNCAAFDISLGCSAFVYGITTVASMMHSSNIDHALLLLGETVSKFANPKDSSVAMLFGDAGAAILLEKTNEPLVINSSLKTDGTGYQAIIAPAGGLRNTNPPVQEYADDEGNIRNLYNTHMQGGNVFSFTISDVPRSLKEFLEHTQTTVADYNCFAMHQANKFILQMIAKKLKVDFSLFPVCLDKYGNTSAPSIPLALCDKYGDANVDENIRVLSSGFGVGLSWGVCAFTICSKDIYPIIETNEIFTEGIINSLDDFLKSE